MFVDYGKLCTQIYEHTKPVGTSINGDIEYYCEHLKNMSGKVLEAGVGTGRMLIPLLQAGIDIVGVDLSAEMLSACKKNLKANGLKGELFKQDISELNINYKFDAIIMPTGSFGLLPTREVARKTLEKFMGHLKPGGKVIIDIELPEDFCLGEVSTSVFELTPEEGILFTASAIELDWQKQQTTTLHRYEKFKNGRLTESELSKFTLSWYGLEEFRLMLKEVGFQEISVAYDYGRAESYKNIATFIGER